MPKVKTLQIVWHGKEPVYSLDFHPNNGTLATAGADKEVKLWEVIPGEDGYASVNHLNTLTGHSKTVNCVRFSPSGSHLVSAGDGGELLLWHPAGAENGASGAEVENWKRAALMRGHTDDVMDLSWAADGTALLSGSIDNKAIVWEVSSKKKGQMVTQFANHKHFVQGVAWDPVQQFVVTQSADRTCKVYALRPPPAGRKNKVNQHLQAACDNSKEFYCTQTLSKRTFTSTKGEEQKIERYPLFHDESIPSFFRRLEWSPDGSFLLVPAGLHPSASSTKDGNTVYIYARGNWAAPTAHLPGHNKPVVAVRFCPIVFERGTDAPSQGPFNLPYKIVFAVATLDSVVVYDTESTKPLMVLGQLHYDSITDLSWSPDAKYLAVASRDCYCSLAVFQPGELGVPCSQSMAAIPQHAKAHVAVAAADARLDVQPMELCPEPSTQPAQAGKEPLENDVPSALAEPSQVPVATSTEAREKEGSVMTVNGKKRITPTPVSLTETADKFGKEAKQAAQPMPSDTQEPAKARRRITPIPVKGSEEGPSPVEAAPMTAAKPAVAAPTFNIAALALAAGQKAAARNANAE